MALPPPLWPPLGAAHGKTRTRILNVDVISSLTGIKPKVYSEMEVGSISLDFQKKKREHGERGIELDYLVKVSRKKSYFFSGPAT